MAGRKPQARAGLAALLLRGVVGNPMATIGGLMMTVTAAAIMTNALALQPGRHPAPLFVGTRPSAPADQLPTASVPMLRSSDGSIVGAVDNSLIADIQQGLKDFGYYKGEVDGLAGPQTSQAILAFERAFHITPTGVPSNNVLLAIRSVRPKTSLNGAVPTETDPLTVASLPAASGVPTPRPKPNGNDVQAFMPVEAAPAAAVTSATAPAAAPSDGIGDLIANVAPPARPAKIAPAPAVAAPVVAASPQLATTASPGGDANIARIQRSLADQGFGPLVADGKMTQETRAAIRQFEDYYGLPQTGTINEAFLAQLVKVGGLQAN